MRLSPHFSTETDPMLKCPCCGKIKISPKLLETLEAVREAADLPVVVESGYRCARHNASLKGSAKNSGHLSGEAADIRIAGWDNARLMGLVKSLHSAGKLKHLEYCYRIKGKTNASLHIGVDEKPNRTGTFGE